MITHAIDALAVVGVLALHVVQTPFASSSKAATTLSPQLEWPIETIGSGLVSPADW